MIVQDMKMKFLAIFQIARFRNAALGARLAKLGPAAGASATLAVLFAAFAFN